MQSDSLIELYRQKHEDPNFGASSLHYPEICLVIEYVKPKTVLDYGCGKGVMLKELAKTFPKINFIGYDPAVSEFDTLLLKTADLVISTDVLEHIPETSLPSVIKAISDISSTAYFNLHHGLAVNILPNGDNAHCTVKPAIWYYELLSRHFVDITPLPGKTPICSSIATFKITAEFAKQYNKVIGNDWKEELNKLRAIIMGLEK